MFKHNYLFLAIGLFFSLFPGVVLSALPTQPPRNNPDSGENPYNICKNGDTDIFSCKLKSDKKLSICANDSPPKLSLNIKKTNGELKIYNFNQAKQLIDAAGQGGATIIKNGSGDSIGLYLDVHSGEGGYSVITVEGSKNELCDNDTVEANVDRLGVDTDQLDLWSLIRLKVTSDFDTHGSDPALSPIWHTWPRP